MSLLCQTQLIRSKPPNEALEENRGRRRIETAAHSPRCTLNKSGRRGMNATLLINEAVESNLYTTQGHRCWWRERTHLTPLPPALNSSPSWSVCFARGSDAKGIWQTLASDVAFAAATATAATAVAPVARVQTMSVAGFQLQKALEKSRRDQGEEPSQRACFSLWLSCRANGLCLWPGVVHSATTEISIRCRMLAAAWRLY